MIIAGLVQMIFGLFVFISAAGDPQFKSAETAGVAWLLYGCMQSLMVLVTRAIRP